MGIFDDFINRTVSDAVNSRKLCPTCDNHMIAADEASCFDCYERRERRDARNDSGAEEV